MEDLFSDLSSISDCDEECLLNVSTKKCKCFFIQTNVPRIVFSTPPAFELEEPEVQSTKQKTLEEKNCETDSKGVEKFDKWVQTDHIEMESQDCSADLPPTFREATYTESALERVLRHISAHLHRAQLQQWLAEQPQRNASFHIKPVQTRTIYKAVYNQEKNVFVLLLHVPEENRYFIELRSLKNLLKSVNHELPRDNFATSEKVNLFSSHHFIALFSSKKVIVLEVDDLEASEAFDTTDAVSLLVLQGGLCYVNTLGSVIKLEDSAKVLDCSPLLNPITLCSVIENRLHVVSGRSISIFSPDAPLDYESYETEKVLARGQVRKFGDSRLMIFDKLSQTCFIWEVDKPKCPSHTLCFGSSEFTVDVACDEENLYSLTAAGVVSVWKLRPNGRKYRDRLFTTFLAHCSKLMLAFPQKFVILTSTEVHFVVFGADTDGQQ